jgi:hypothetical protein
MGKAQRRGRASKGAKRVALYLRVSTAEQTTANQLRQLRQSPSATVGLWCRFSRTPVSPPVPKAAANGRRWTSC